MRYRKKTGKNKVSFSTVALLQCLEDDLSAVLDPYQIELSFRSERPIWPDASIKQYQAFYLARSILKKFNNAPSPGEEACSAALAKFLSVNQRMGSVSIEPADIRDEELINGVANFMYDFWYLDGETPLVSCLSQLFDSGKLGSGMNRFARGSDLYTKLWDSPLSATEKSLLASWQQLCMRDVRWAAAERHRHKNHGTHIVPGNKLSFVNKNVAVARCISTEPTVNMWFQLGLEHHMRQRLGRRYSIWLETQQEINKELARLGSYSGRLATIDLESASDSVSLALIDRICPPDMKSWLHLLRSPSVQLPNGSERRLEMLSTMGNGFTFPIETTIFLAVVVTSYKHCGIKPRFGGVAKERNLGVFGDDIIVDVRAFDTVMRLLTLLGFIANRDKTYSSGPFRESCGGDYVSGHHCRGVYIKSLRNKQDFCVAINLLNRWSALTGIFVPRTVQHLMEQAGTLLVPPVCNDDAGVHVPFDQVRRCERLPHGSIRFRQYEAVADTFRVDEGGSIVMECRGVNRNANYEALYLAFLHGDIRGYRQSLRRRVPRYRTRHSVVPSWDYLPPHRQALGLDWQRWSDAVYYNLNL